MSDTNNDISTRNSRIARNTLLLYIRMLFVMAVNLYTGRVVLRTLGVEDFGIYNVVGGVVAMFSFINGSMTVATQRYITFELGRGDSPRLQRIFNTSLLIHLLIALLVALLAETAGLWFLHHEMQLPALRIPAAVSTFHYSLLATMVMIATVPFNAAIIAHERMSVFACIGILEVVLKLATVGLLTFASADKLPLYALLILSVQLAVSACYVLYCRHHFRETRLRLVWDKPLMRDMSSFAAWSLFGNLASITCTQGVNLLLNVFFGPMVNAARGIAVQVQSAVGQFSANFQTALNPQITKSYATDQGDYMQILIRRSAKFTCFLLLLLSLPILLQTGAILQLWLGEVPRHAATFVRLMLCITTVDAMSNSLMIAASATGRIRTYQALVGGTLLLILPASYVVLRMGGAPSSVFVVQLAFCGIAFALRLLLVKRLTGLSVGKYMREVLLPCAAVVIFSLPLPLLLMRWWQSGSWLAVAGICLSAMLSVALAVYLLGLDKEEKLFIRKRLKRIGKAVKGGF